MFELAKVLTKHSEHHKAKIGAVISRGNRIISSGFNKLKTSPRSAHPWKTIHAEMAAILSANTDLRGCDLYVYREKKDGELANSKPCKYCMMMIEEAGIRNIYYTDNGKFAKVGT